MDVSKEFYYTTYVWQNYVEALPKWSDGELEETSLNMKFKTKAREIGKYEIHESLQMISESRKKRDYQLMKHYENCQEY